MDNDTVQKELVIQSEMGYFDRLLRSTDMFVNVLLGGDLDDTISSRVARWRLTGSQTACVLCRILNILFRTVDHCTESLDADSARAILEKNRDST